VEILSSGVNQEGSANKKEKESAANSWSPAMLRGFPFLPLGSSVDNPISRNQKEEQL
jgi:hypothetical protein